MNNFDLYIEDYFNKQKNNQVIEAMHYAIEGGKHFRPLLIFALLKDLELDEEIGYDAALALEMIHTYSLIHDDLPAMDNDDYRRGKLSVHKAFGEDIAILAGDELLTDAFKVLSNSNSYDDKTKINLIKTFSKYAGNDGMVYGQLLDLTTSNENNLSKEFIDHIHDNKTGGLFKIACLVPMYLKGLDNEEYFIELGSRIGKIFQKQDDLFDLIRTKEEMGKDLSDIENDKATALSIYNKDELSKIIDDEFNELDKYLDVDFIKGDNLKQLLIKLKER